MNRREEFHEILVKLLGTRQVYFQPPSSVKMKYPAIVYERNNISVLFADDMLYRDQQGYTITVIDPNPDSIIPKKVAKLPFTRFDRHYPANNLNHDVYNTYY